ncbi:MAG: ABC transporter permease subunit [Gammaproteobacteria bacterium]|nr:ABC transporter permease subunit [Gammaproteobacteria bacterium]
MSGFAIAGYEVRRLLRDRALPALLILLLGLGAYAAWNGADWVHKREAAIALIKAEDQEWLADGRQFVVQSYPSVILPITQPVLPPPAMAPLSVGQGDVYHFTAEIFPLGDYTYLFRRVWADIGSPTVRAAGRFDLAFVIVFLLPLVILATTFDLWSRERERGVAAMVLSQPVAVGPLIAAKALARGLVVLLPSTAIILAVTAWAGAREPVGLTALALAVLAYGGFWLAVAVIISLIARRSTEAAIAAGAVWLLVVVMAPSLTLAAVDLTTPAPSEMRFATDLKARVTEISERQRLYREANPTPVRAPAPTIPDRLRGVYADRVALDREVAPMITAHHQARDARRQLLDTVRFFLPSVAIQDALDRIAGSDADRALAFESQARAAQSELRLIYKGYLDRDALVTPTEYDNMPGFRFRESGGAFQTGVLADLAALIAATLLILAAAWALRGQAATL